MARIYSSAPAWTGTIASGGVSDGSTTTIPLSSATGLTDGAYYVMSIDRVDASGNKTPSKWEVVAGQLSGTNLINCIRGVEGTAQAHSAGATVEVLFTSYHWEQLKSYLENDYISEKKASGSDINTGTEDAKIVTPKAIADSYLYTEGGWIPARETWAYASSTTFTISGDKTGKYQKGDKIRLKQGGGYKYFYIWNVSYSSPNTIITVFAGADYSLTNSSITDNFYSRQSAPYGFPIWFTTSPNSRKVKLEGNIAYVRGFQSCASSGINYVYLDINYSNTDYTILITDASGGGVMPPSRYVNTYGRTDLFVVYTGSAVSSYNVYFLTIGEI